MAKAGRGEELSAPPAREVAVFGMSVQEPPEWLPDGWTMEVRRGKNGNIYRYYTSPVSGYTFCTKAAVMHYLNVVKVDGVLEFELSAGSGDDSPRPVQQVKNTFNWLPPGWILEVRFRRRGSNTGQTYKSFFDPSTGSRFHSKGDVLQFVKAGKISSPTSDEKRHCKVESTDNVIAQIEFYPDGLPHGWYKEIRFKRNQCRIRKDPYYADPVSGYVFRTLKDVQRYIETGEISKYAFRPGKRSLYDIYSLEGEHPFPCSAKKLKSAQRAVKRCLFSGQVQNSNGEAVIETDELDEKPDLSSMDHASLQCVDDTVSVCSIPNINHGKQEKAKKSKKMFETVFDNLSEPASYLTSMVKKERNDGLMPARKTTSESILQSKKKAKRGRPKVLKQKKPSEPAMEMLDSLEREQLDLADEKSSEMSDKEPNKPADMAPQQLLIEYPARWENTESLEQENGKLPDGKLEKIKIQGPEKLLEPEDDQSSPSEPDKGVTKDGSSKAKTKKAVTLPRRASKRLAGLEAGPPADDSRIGYRFRWAMSKCISDQTKHLVVLENQKTEEQTGEAALREQAEAGKPTDDPPLALPFGDSWPDPCLEFAFKTLTGDIPVSDESVEIHDFFDQQLNPVQNSNPSGLASATFAGGPECSSLAKLPAQPGSPDNNCSSPREMERPSCSTMTKLQSSGKVIQRCRRARS